MPDLPDVQCLTPTVIAQIDAVRLRTPKLEEYEKQGESQGSRRVSTTGRRGRNMSRVGEF